MRAVRQSDDHGQQHYQRLAHGGRLARQVAGICRTDKQQQYLLSRELMKSEDAEGFGAGVPGSASPGVFFATRSGGLVVA